MKYENLADIALAVVIALGLLVVTLDSLDALFL